MQRRHVVFVLVLIAICPELLIGQTSPNNSSYLMYVGTYTGPESKGIYAFRFDAATGKAMALGLAAESSNPSFLAVDPKEHFLYAVNEIGDYKGEKSGGVSSFAI